MKNLLIAALTVVFVGWFSSSAFADIKLRQKVSMGEQSFETTRMIKGARERTEQKIETGGEESEFMPQIATIVQCDLRRTVRLNDRQKLYFVELFPEEVNLPTGQPNTNKSVQTRRGGTVTITYLVTDTGERKTMFGLTARHLKILQEIESSPDSCGGANKSKMETDGWYADFSADFNCPIDVPQGFPQNKPNPIALTASSINEAARAKSDFY